MGLNSVYRPTSAARPAGTAGTPSRTSAGGGASTSSACVAIGKPSDRAERTPQIREADERQQTKQMEKTKRLRMMVPLQWVFFVKRGERRQPRAAGTG